MHQTTDTRLTLRFMMGMKWAYIFVFFTCFFDKVGATDEKAIEVLEKTCAYYQELTSFKAVYDCTLTIHYPESEEPCVQSSKMELAVSGEQYRLALDGQETITDGTTMWIYDKTMKEVTISNYSKQNFSFHFSNLHNLYQQGCYPTYIQTKVISKKKQKVQDVIQLVPTEDHQEFQSIQLIIDRASAQIHGFDIVQNEELSYRFRMKSLAVNITLPDDYFTFDLNAHDLLEVVDLREDEASFEQMETNEQ